MRSGGQAVELATSIDAVSAQEWDALSSPLSDAKGGPAPFAQHRWLRLAEAVLADYRPRYLLVRRAGRLTAAAVGALEHRLQNPVLDARYGWLVRRSPFLQVGIPMRGVPGLLVADGPDTDRELRELFRTLHAVTRRQRFLFSIVDHLPLGHQAVVGHTGYTELAWLPDTVLELGFTSFEDYLAAMPRKRRTEISRTRRRAEREGIAVAALTPTPENGPVLDRLVAEVVRRHGGTRQYAPGLFLTAAADLGEDLTVLGAHRHGELVACVSLLRCGDEFDVRWIGRDYAKTEGTAVYHALLTGCVGAAVAAGARRLHFGAAAYDSKRQFGVTLLPRTRLFASRYRAATWLIRALGHRFEPPGQPHQEDVS